MKKLILILIAMLAFLSFSFADTSPPIVQTQISDEISAMQSLVEKPVAIHAEYQDLFIVNQNRQKNYGVQSVSNQNYINKTHFETIEEHLTLTSEKEFYDLPPERNFLVESAKSNRIRDQGNLSSFA